MSSLDQETSSLSSSVAEIFVAEVAAHLNSSPFSLSSSSTCERASYSSVVRRSIQDTRCASFIVPQQAHESELEPKQEQDPEPALEQTSELEIENKSVVPRDDTVSLEKPKLPFTDSGKLVGDRTYGDWVVNPKKLKQLVVVIDEPQDCMVAVVDAPAAISKAELEQSAGSCILL